MAFDLNNYVDVPTRLTLALAKYPDLRVQETDSQTVTMPDGSTFLRCTLTVWRDATDVLPTIASAAEPYPGKTPYTKGSELMVGMTSALGRALGYMGFGLVGADGKKSIASRNEVEARTDTSWTNEHGAVTTRTQYPKPLKDVSSVLASPKQKGLIRALAKGHELDGADMVQAMRAICDDEALEMDNLTVIQASFVIDRWKEPKQ